MNHIKKRRIKKKQRTAFQKVRYPAPYVGHGINLLFYANRNANLRGGLFDSDGLKAVKPPDGSKNIGSNGLDRKIGRRFGDKTTILDLMDVVIETL